MGKLFAYILVLLPFCAWSQPSYLLHKPYSVQFPFIDSIRRVFDDQHTHPANDAPEKIGELVRWAASNNDEELASQLKLIMYRNTIRNVQNEQIRQELVGMIVNAQARKYKYVEANAHIVYGDYLGLEKKYGQAFEQYLEAYNVYSAFTAEEFPFKKRFLCDLGVQYAQNGDVSDAIRLLKEANSIKGDNEMENPINNAIGLQYRSMNKYDSAILYFRKIYANATGQNDRQWIGISAGNIGICYYYQGQYDEAIPLLIMDIDTSFVSHQVQNAIRSSAILADIYYRRKEYGGASVLLQRALTEGESRPFWPKYDIAAQIFGLMSKLYAEKNDMQKAYLYMDSANVAKDSFATQYNSLNVVQANEKIEMVQKEMERQKMDNEKRFELLIRNCLIGGICMLLVIGLLFINRQRLQRNKLVAEKEAELKMATIQLDSFRHSMQEKNSMIEQFTGELEKLKSGKQQESTEDVLTQLQHAIILTDQQWENFRLTFDKVHRNFFVNLKNKFPDLTQAEIRFLALTKLKLSSKEMASMLGISPNAIRMYRYRLRKKLELDKEDMIEPLIEQI